MIEHKIKRFGFTYEEIARRARVNLIREKELTQTDLEKIKNYKPRIKNLNHWEHEPQINS